MASNTVQGSNAILYVFTNSWVEYACASSFSIQLSADTQSVKTIGDGYWAKNAYKGSSYSLTLANVLRTTEDGTKFSGFDFLRNFLNFTEIKFKITFSDDADVIKSIQGSTLITNLNFNQSQTDLVKNDITLIGNDTLLFYEGADPCPVSIDTITVSGQTSGSGDITVTYTYTGSLYMVKYRLDGVGDYSYALLAANITFSSLTVGSHYIEMIPICQNGYMSDSLVQSFQVTYAMTCALSVSSILATQSGTTVTAQVNFNANPSSATLKYSLNGAPFIQYAGGILTNPTLLYFTDLPVSAMDYTLVVTPTCANGVDGGSGNTSFSVISGPVLSTITYSYNQVPPGSTMQIFKNGYLLYAFGGVATGVSGTFTALPSDTIIVQLGTTNPSGGPYNNRQGELKVDDTTTHTTIHDAIYNVYNMQPNKTITYTFSPSSGHSYAITTTVISN